MPTTPLGIPTPADSTKISKLAETQRSGFNKVDELLSGQITPELEHAIADAAAGALDAEISQQDFVQGDDTRVLRTVTAPDYAIVNTDGDGYIAGGWMADGTHNFEKAPRVMGAQGVVAQPAIAPGWAYVHTDAQGYVAFGIRDDGTVVAPKGQFDATSIANAAIGMTRSKRTDVATPGDSLTNGWFDGRTQEEFSWPARFATLAPSVTVTNVAESGWVVDEIAIKLGAMEMPLTVSGGSIPASGAVTVTCPTEIGWHPNGISRSFTGTLAGVTGVLRHETASDAYTFTRSTAGDSTPVAPGTLFIPESTVHSADTLLTMAGHNDVAFGVVGPEGNTAQHVVNGIRRIYQWASRQLKQFMVMSVTTKVTWTSGTSQYFIVKSINDALAAEYTTRYYDLRQYLVNEAIYDLGITPTANDLAAMAGDTLPPSIMDPGADGTGDITHYSKDTAALVGDHVFDWVTLRDWIIQ